MIKHLHIVSIVCLADFFKEIKTILRGVGCLDENHED